MSTDSRPTSRRRSSVPPPRPGWSTLPRSDSSRHPIRSTAGLPGTSCPHRLTVGNTTCLAAVNGPESWNRRTFDTSRIRAGPLSTRRRMHRIPSTQRRFGPQLRGQHIQIAAQLTHVRTERGELSREPRNQRGIDGSTHNPIVDPQADASHE